jgi:hypothetical protein
MCGIIGLYGDSTHINTKDKRGFFQEGLFVDSLRGQDSTGIARIPRGSSAPEVYKRALAGPDFLQRKDVARLLDKFSASVGMIGHNRSITRGVVDDDSAHPFQYKHITLVHNGTVYNSDKLVDRKCEADSNVDSAQVAWSFSLCEPDDLLPIMTGGFSLVWWDSRDQTLHFARNSERPMYWVVEPSNRMMYFGSELKMLTWLLDRNGISVKPKAMFTAPGTHYIFKNPQNLEEYTKRPFLKAAPVSQVQGGKTDWEKTRDKLKEKRKHTQTPHGSTGAVLALPDQSKQVERGGPGTATPSPTSSTTNPSSGSNTDITEETADAASKSGFFTNNGKKHPAESEVIKKGMVGTFLSSLKEKRHVTRTRELANAYGADSNKVLVADKKMWKPYNDEDSIGTMFLRSGRANIQVFNIARSYWIKISSLQKLPVKIVGHRTAHDDTVFIGEVSLEAVDRMLQNKKEPTWDDDPAKSVIQRNIETAEDEVEIGTIRTRYVSVAKFKELVDPGCTQCMKPILLQDAPKVGWYGDEEEWPLCPTCMSQASVVAEFEAMQEYPTRRH